LEFSNKKGSNKIERRIILLLTKIYKEPPSVITQWLDAGEFLLSDISELIQMESLNMIEPSNLYKCLDLEEHLKDEERKKKMKDINDILSITKDKETRKKLLKQLEELNG